MFRLCLNVGVCCVRLYNVSMYMSDVAAKIPWSGVRNCSTKYGIPIPSDVPLTLLIEKKCHKDVSCRTHHKKMASITSKRMKILWISKKAHESLVINWSDHKFYGGDPYFIPQKGKYTIDFNLYIWQVCLTQRSHWNDWLPVRFSRTGFTSLSTFLQFLQYI